MLASTSHAKSSPDVEQSAGRDRTGGQPSLAAKKRNMKKGMQTIVEVLTDSDRHLAGASS
jgi:hypothetical protein